MLKNNRQQAFSVNVTTVLLLWRLLGENAAAFEPPRTRLDDRPVTRRLAKSGARPVIPAKIPLFSLDTTNA
jgi:hypothetical protein